MKCEQVSKEDFYNFLHDRENSVVIDGNDIVLNVRYEYRIELSRIDNPTKLVWWIHHLNEKRWVTGQIINRLIEIATEQMGLIPYQGEG